VSTLVAALLPIVVVLGLGYFAGMHHDFAPAQAAVLNRMVMLYALPLSLFAGIMATPRSELFSNAAMFAWIVIGMGGGWFVVFAISRYLFHRDAPTAALQALAIAGPAVPFVGTSVLGTLFHNDASLAIAVGSLAMNLIQVPAVMLVLNHTAPKPAGITKTSGAASTTKAAGHGRSVHAASTTKRAADAAASVTKPAPATSHPSSARRLLASLRSTVVEPIVWAPVAAMVLVICGVKLPTALHASLMLLGQATGGVALFASGVVLFAQKVSLSGQVWINVAAKNLVLPAVIWGGMVLTGAGQVATGLAVVTLAIPTASIPTILAIQYGVAIREMASTLFVSTVGSVVTMAGFILLTGA
jgi:predicted permease